MHIYGLWTGVPNAAPLNVTHIVSIFIVFYSVTLDQNSNLSLISVVKTLVNTWSTLAHIEDMSWIDRQCQPYAYIRSN